MGKVTLDRSVTFVCASNFYSTAENSQEKTYGTVGRETVGRPFLIFGPLPMAPLCNIQGGLNLFVDTSLKLKG